MDELDTKTEMLDNIITGHKDRLTSDLVSEWEEHPVTNYLLSVLDRDRVACMSFIMHRALSGSDTQTEVTQLKDIESFIQFIKEISKLDDEEIGISENTRH